MYQFDDSLFTLAGNVVFANFRAARLFAQKMNARKDLVTYPERTVRAGQINALGLIDEIMHFVVGLYLEQRAPNAMQEALSALDDRLGREAVDASLRRFVEAFPPVSVYRRDLDGGAWLEGATGGVPNREIALEEMLMLWLTNANPATAPFMELFDDADLEKGTAYLQIISQLRQFFAEQPRFGPQNQPLVEMLRAPAIAVPHSLSGQLEYILQNWGYLLGKFLYRLLGSLDLIKEEEKMVFLGPGPATVPVYDYASLEYEPERFSQDKDWMPNLVMIAKNSYVWLDQLSHKYQRAITRLDQIPDEELDQLARWGFTGLWFIGIWERSPASQHIKQMMGNPDAVASAYSLMEYQIAADLGGEEAYQNLRHRAWRRGVRLASDMVPNHMAIDSRWVMEHPDWFVQVDYPPFPSYSFNGPDLSWDPRVAIQIEDHYYNRSDAAVVFRRTDKWTGNEKYIYHGNDGTSFPWNDTAQLNYLRSEVREAVIQTILHVARKFPIIRFDAAMTLAKKHFQRLWFPEPGTGGAIPSRAEHGMTKAQFDALMPVEFWREVVDRVAAEAPDTLLLAEAFWLLEGYFVRTLGMHRVYNSAFMHMMRDEDNAKYRSVIKNTIEFDPEILKRYVNFMNNPDERTAVDQFGKADKYFGVCTVMVTMPGLPMFGHGQIEGFAEKYGMDFRHPLWDEQADEWLVQRHEREIFPLLHKRYLFAGVENFLLYDFFNTDGTVNEDVFAYSNRKGEERGLVLYHSRFADARGWIRSSAAYLDKSTLARSLVQKSLGEGLALQADENTFAIFRDQASGLEFIRSSKDLCENGLYVELGAYKYHVFVDWREVQDNAWHHYANLNTYLNGRGVPSILEALREVFMQPVREPFTDLVNAEMFRRLIQARVKEPAGAPDQELMDEVEQKLTRLLAETKRLSGGSGDEAARAKEIRNELETVLLLPILPSRFPELKRETLAGAMEYLQSRLNDDPGQWGALFSWVFVHALGKMTDQPDYEEQSRAWIDEWLLGKIIAGALQDLGLDYNAAWWLVSLVKIMTAQQCWFEATTAYQALSALLQDGDARTFLQVNRYQGVLWYNKESFDQVLLWMFRIAVVSLSLAWQEPPDRIAESIAAANGKVRELQRAEEQSKFQVEKLLEAAKEERAIA